ncbi:MAG TPA: M1 family metallopeptidase [Anaerolineales bacterium]|nr:M1 family metallopeptidase [Anaerolineales bacterium]
MNNQAPAAVRGGDHANRKIAICILCLWILSSCTLPSSAPPSNGSGQNFLLVTPDPSALPTSTPFQPAGAVLAPPEATLIATFTPLPPTDTPLPTLAFTATSLALPTSPAPAARTQYTIFAILDYAGHQLAADETIRYTNQTGVALSELLLAVPANLEGGFTPEHIVLDGQALNFDLSGQRLTVSLPQPLAPNAQAALAMRFRISIPPKPKEHPYGYDVDQVNLTDWYPFVVPYDNGWILHEPSSWGEYLVYDSSDFEVNIKTTQTGIVIAASGIGEPNGEWTRYRLSGGRTFALSASDQFLVLDAVAGGAAIRSYYYPGYEDQGLAILNAAVRAIGLFETQFGPFPYESLSIIQADVNDGQEYDGLVFLGTKFYNEYDGSARSNLVAIGVHEIAHQWWFGLVGSDQAMEPWLDEALCIYSEEIFYRFIYPNSHDWWWNFRVNYFGPTGYVDSTIYEAASFRAYVNASYLNGANFLEALNFRMGDDAFFQFLRDYASRYARGHASGYDFFAVARQNTTEDISDLINAYFKGSY